MTEAYSRLYHKFSREFPTVYADDAALASWVRLLLVADASWPMRPPVPRSVKARPLAVLVKLGLVILDGDNYTVLGLDAERTRRRESARIGAAQRWQNDRNANADATGMPRRDETRRTGDKGEIPPPPAERGRRKDRTNPRATGSAPRDLGTNQRSAGTSTRQVRELHKRGPSALSEVLRKAAAAGYDA